LYTGLTALRPYRRTCRHETLVLFRCPGLKSDSDVLCGVHGGQYYCSRILSHGLLQRVLQECSYNPSLLLLGGV